MSLELCKFLCVHLTRFRLVKKQSATVKAHTCALSLHGPFNGGFLRYEFGGLYLEELIHGGAYFRNFTVPYERTLTHH